MVINPHGPIPLERGQIADAANVLSRAFCADPAVCHFYPQAETRQAAFARSARCLLRYGLLYGEAYVTSPRVEGVAVWLPPGRNEPSNWGMLRAGAPWLAWSNGWGAFRRVLAFLAHAVAMRRRHVHEAHWYLQMLGVDPRYHRAGHGGLLLRSMLGRTDREQLPCCLDTENEVNVPMYQHFGFRVLEASPIPGTDRTVWLMFREVGAGPMA